MKKLKWFILSLFLCVSLNAQIPISFNVNIGDSPITGLLGVEFEISRFALSAGWRPNGTMNPWTPINSYIAGFSIYSNELNKIEVNMPGIRNYLYFSSGYSSSGFLVKNEEKESGYTSIPSILLMTGIRTYLFPNVAHRLSTKIGVGCNLNKSSSHFTFEIIFNFLLFKNKP